MAEIKYIKKRDGRIVDFNIDRIINAVYNAAESVGGQDRALAEELALEILNTLKQTYGENEVPTVEEVQDIVEKILIKTGHAKTSKAYILYRKERAKKRELKEKGIEFDDSKNSPEVIKLKSKEVQLSDQAKHVLNNSIDLEELGRIVFLDRYSLKAKRETIKKGDLVIAITKEDSKYPKKDLGIIADLQKDKATLHMLTGIYADKKNDYKFTQNLRMLDKPVEATLDMYKRVAKAVASAETTPEKKDMYFGEFFYQLRKHHLSPGGRILAGANVDKFGNYLSNLTLYNCYVIPSPEDSRQGIIGTLGRMIEVMSRGGGVGISLSTLRPKYAYVKGVHGKSSGSVSWGGLYSYGTALIEQGGSRRGALMLMQADWHPDIIDFIESKTKMGAIENANISVMVSDHFMEALKKDEDWNLEYPDYENVLYKDKYDIEWTGDLFKWKEKGYPTKVYKTVKARWLWDKLIKSAWLSAEPGVVFMERYNKMSNSWYFNPIICTNPCGEQGLPPWGVCNLGHLYLASFANMIGKDEEGPMYEFDWEEFKRASRSLSRFLDNVIDMTPYFFEENRKNQMNERRIGGGTLGLGELLIKLRVKYGSDESIKLIDRIYKTMVVEMYLESTRTARDKGAFPKFDAEKFLQSGFMQGMPEEVKEAIKKDGIRNVTLTTQAPTGSTGTMLGTSTGIEPYYGFNFFRQSRLGFHKVDIPLVKDYKKDSEGKLPEYFISSANLGPLDHVKVQAAVQRWTDSSISKTANAPADFTLEQTKELYEKAYDLGCKGVTIYRESSRSEEVLSRDSDTEQKNLASSHGLIDKDLTKQQPVKKETEEKKMLVPIEVTAKLGLKAGELCPNCEEGKMIKIGGCTECSNQCGSVGLCDAGPSIGGDLSITGDAQMGV